MLFIDVAMRAKSPEDLERLLPSIQRAMAETQKEKGCLIYRFTVDLCDPSIVRVTELWESEEDLNAHFAGEPIKLVKQFLPELARLGVQAYKGPLAAHQLPLPADIANR